MPIASSHYQQKIDEATNFVRDRVNSVPRVAIILGTGLGKLATHIKPEVTLPYDEIPHFPQATALSHQGQLVLGTLEGIPVVAMQGDSIYMKATPLRMPYYPCTSCKSLELNSWLFPTPVVVSILNSLAATSW